MPFFVHLVNASIRYGRSAGQQNNKHEDPILTFGYVWGDDVVALMTADSTKPFAKFNYQVKFEQNDREWRGRIVAESVDYSVPPQPGQIPPLLAHVYFFAVTPRMKKADKPTPEAVESTKRRKPFDPTTITVTVTNPSGAPITTPAPRDTTVDIID